MVMNRAGGTEEDLDDFNKLKATYLWSSTNSKQSIYVLVPSALLSCQYLIPNLSVPAST